MSESKTGKIFIKGLLFSLPILLTTAIMVWVVKTMDTFLADPIKAVLPGHFYFPGMGILIALAIIYLVGLAIQGRVMGFLFQWTQILLHRLPVVNVIYQNLKELIDFVSGARDKDLEQVVLVTLPNKIKMMGFVTQTEPDLGREDTQALLAVYLPMSYQMGGYLIYVPETEVETLDISKKEAMQRIITADISGTGNVIEEIEEIGL